MPITPFWLTGFEHGAFSINGMFDNFSGAPIVDNSFAHTGTYSFKVAPTGAGAVLIPMVGASGAISGVMGAYLVLYPRVRVFTFVFLGFFLTSIALPAWVMLIYWMLLQVLGGFTRFFSPEEGGVAFWAHVGGFVAGVILIKIFERPDRVRSHMAGHWRPERVGWQ